MAQAAEASKRGIRQRPLRRRRDQRCSRPEGAIKSRTQWPFLMGLAAFHLAVPLAFLPGMFSWIGLALVPLGNYVFCSLGIGAGFHRLLTHRSFTCKRWLEHTLAVLGVCSLQDSPVRWVIIHRLHHNHADDQNDPHTPMVTWFWGHMGWVTVENRQLSMAATYDKYARDLLQDPFYFWLERRNRWAVVYLIHALLFVAAGFVVGLGVGAFRALPLAESLVLALQYAACWLLWGVIVRTVYSWHVTWGVNSFCHQYGYRNFETGENSRNNALWAFLTNGEGWHNNHHADPRSAAHGQRWWELDITHCSIRLLEKLGLVWDVVSPRRLEELASD